MFHEKINLQFTIFVNWQRSRNLLVADNQLGVLPRVGEVGVSAGVLVVRVL